MPAAEQRTAVDRLLQGLPAVGAAAGAATGALWPGLIDAGRSGGDLKHRAIAAALGAGTGATLGWLPAVVRDGMRAVKPEKVALAAARGRDLVHYMWDELEKVSAFRMELANNPWDLGVHAKRTRDDQRGVGYTHGVGKAGVVGAALAAVPGAVLGGSALQRTLTQKGREAAVDDLAKDVAIAGQAYLKTKHEIAGKSFAEVVGELRAAALTGTPSTGAETALQRVADTAKKMIASPEVKELVSRRAKAAGKSMLAGGAALAALKGIYNVSEYESARALTNGPKEKRAEARGQDAIAEILGTEIESLDAKRARGYPIIQAPPGYAFNPDLSQFQPDPNQPGWMPEEEAAVAQQNQQMYQQGQQDQAQGAAQQELDTSIDQQAQQLAGQQQQQQQIQVEKQMQKLQTPPAVAGAASPAVPKPKKPKAKAPAGITIKVGSDNIHDALEKLAEERRGSGMTSAGAVGLGLGMGGLGGIGGASMAKVHSLLAQARDRTNSDLADVGANEEIKALIRKLHGRDSATLLSTLREVGREGDGGRPYGMPAAEYLRSMESRPPSALRGLRQALREVSPSAAGLGGIAGLSGGAAIAALAHHYSNKRNKPDHS